MLGTRSPTERLAHLLLQLVDLYGVDERDGTLIAAPFTHADLAHMIGVTRQWVTTTFKSLVEKDIVDSRGVNILIKDRAILATMRDGKTSKAGNSDKTA
jgi:CRP-like cAMP-binding protein